MNQSSRRKVRKILDQSAWSATSIEHEKYLVAHAEAQTKANLYGFDYGIERNDLFKEFHVFMLPAEQFRSGHELRCEVVKASR